ncbi:hypothetical protein [Aliikangiella sp. G2MR2-5]|uniref:hypothetical protein n=1 Tax=Aliikangiella sp. G2MR2-5 TaxID=2788943 RepID=UPI0018AC3A7E|nr:hypothetical protein [Aliikangiella sp. G2MR2-5]
MFEKVEARDLDGFLEAIRQQVGLAQEAIEHKSQQRIARLTGGLKMVGDGKELVAQIPSLDIRLPEKIGMESKRMVKIPVASILQPVEHKISGVTLNFEVELEHFSVEGKKSVALRIISGDVAKSSRRYNMRVELIGRQPGKVNVYINGTLFKQIEK